MKMNGIEFFPFSAVSKGAVKMIEAEFKAVGLAIYVKLLQQIFSYEGYYLVADKDAVLIVKQELGIDINDDIVDRVIKSCIERDLFDKKMYEDYNILTSNDIQQDYLIAVKKRKSVKLIKNYLLEYATNFYDKMHLNEKKEEFFCQNDVSSEKKEEFFHQNALSAEKMTEFFNRGEKRIEEERIQDNTREEYTREREQENCCAFSLSHEETLNNNNANQNYIIADDEVVIEEVIKRNLQQNEFERLNEQLPDKRIVKHLLVPNFFDVDLFLKSVKESTFLRSASNLNFKWLIKNYEDVVSGFYKDYEKSNNKDLFNDIDLL
ncbi:MAG: DUF4373 domain-containing protein [Clostridia bacterium]|nr:DUF4373 domain-containing protein [Clostridia bacterium]